MKDNWYRRNNGEMGATSSPTLNEFDVERYEWAFALAALTFSMCIGFIIIKCWTKKYVRVRGQGSESEGADLKEKRLSIDQPPVQAFVPPRRTAVVRAPSRDPSYCQS